MLHGVSVRIDAADFRVISLAFHFIFFTKTHLFKV